MKNRPFCFDTTQQKCTFAACEARCTFVYTKRPKGPLVYPKVPLPLRGQITRNSLFYEREKSKISVSNPSV